MVLQHGPGASQNQGISSRMNNWYGQEGSAVKEADNPRVLKAAEVLPESVRRNAGRMALLGERALALEDGAQDVIVCQGLPIRRRMADKEIELRQGGGYCRHRILPQA